ncbi:MAG TPA: hypothetical protein VF715_10900 [Thermoleophilaceae bacterium]|jgi:hypothetical protein
MKVFFGGMAFAMLLALGATATASAAQELTVHTFSGYCDYEGFIQFRDPVGVVPEPNVLVFDVAGPCTGTLDGRQVVNETARFQDKAEGMMSCTQGLQIDGPGRMRINGATIGFGFTEFRFGPVSKFSFTGESGGSLEGVGATSDELPFLIDRCMAGDGSLRRVNVYAHIAGSISG